VAHIEETKGGRHEIVITEIPYQVNKTTLIERWRARSSRCGRRCRLRMPVAYGRVRHLRFIPS
jgi:hypothetical protein